MLFRFPRDVDRSSLKAHRFWAVVRLPEVESMRFLLSLLLILAVTPVAKTAVSSPVGKKIDTFEIRDFRGTSHKLEDLAGSKVLVVAFLGTECPLAKLYAPRLQDLAQKYQGKGVQFVGINSN